MFTLLGPNCDQGGQTCCGARIKVSGHPLGQSASSFEIYPFRLVQGEQGGARDKIHRSRGIRSDQIRSEALDKSRIASRLRAELEPRSPRVGRRTLREPSFPTGLGPLFCSRLDVVLRHLHHHRYHTALLQRTPLGTRALAACTAHARTRIYHPFLVQDSPRHLLQMVIPARR